MLLMMENIPVHVLLFRKNEVLPYYKFILDHIYSEATTDLTKFRQNIWNEGINEVGKRQGLLVYTVKKQHQCRILEERGREMG